MTLLEAYVLVPMSPHILADSRAKHFLAVDIILSLAVLAAEYINVFLSPLAIFIYVILSLNLIEDD